MRCFITEFLARIEREDLVRVRAVRAAARRPRTLEVAKVEVETEPERCSVVTNMRCLGFRRCGKCLP